MRKIREKIKRPTKEFEQFLEMVNLLRNTDLPGYTESFLQFEREWILKLGKISGECSQKASKERGIFLLRIILNLPEEFRDYIVNKAKPDETNTDRLLYKYEEFRNDRNTLIDTVSRIEKFPHHEEILIYIADSRPVHVSVNKEGEFIYKVAGFQNFDGFDFRRFKTCPICKKIFWAERKDKTACSPECSLLLSQQVFQNKNKDVLNREKRRAYYINKKIKFCVECVHQYKKYGCSENNCNYMEEKV